MVELRWAVQPGTTTNPPVLQYRLRGTEWQGSLGLWGEWQPVPYFVMPDPIGFNSGDLIAAMFRDGAGS